MCCAGPARRGQSECIAGRRAGQWALCSVRRGPSADERPPRSAHCPVRSIAPAARSLRVGPSREPGAGSRVGVPLAVCASRGCSTGAGRDCLRLSVRARARWGCGFWWLGLLVPSPGDAVSCSGLAGARIPCRRLAPPRCQCAVATTLPCSLQAAAKAGATTQATTLRQQLCGWRRLATAKCVEMLE
jgi:hypothetical protein